MADPNTPEFPTGREIRAAYHAAIEHEMLSLYRELGRDKPRKEDEKTFLSKGKYTQYHRLLELMATAAQEYVVAQKQSLDEFEQLLSEALDVCTDIRRALKPIPKERDDPFVVWVHAGQLRSYSKHEDFPPIHREALYYATGRYLKLPIRVPAIDRILTDALIAAETLGYAAEFFIKSKSKYSPSRSPFFQPHILRTFFVGAFWNFVVCCGPAALVFYLGTRSVMDAGWSMGVSLVLVALFVVFVVLQMIALPSAWKQQLAVRKKIAELMQEMLTTYDELRDDGPVSANRVYDLATAAAKTGVSWPASLFALLDDVKLRGARL